ncbi:hypothetical protein AK812_SmicGene37492 [Symbiodinium microadriaticum]|uniref:Uncharacterized protein n=1 Tax=Symbiodinium microadriaticum TaxID=2951 RepID=A0A1Q9CG35_SYMMI|nr:hypothetical protein AK812_SmicGene37492 [Symbiodinium microadriaticum]
MGRRSGAFGAFAAAATTPAKTGAFSRFADEAPGDAPKVTPVRTKRNSPAPELSLDEVRRLLEELRTVSNSAKFQKDSDELRRMDWGAFKKREAVAKLLSIFWKATLRKHGFSIDGAGFPNLLQVVKTSGKSAAVRPAFWLLGSSRQRGQAPLRAALLMVRQRAPPILRLLVVLVGLAKSHEAEDGHESRQWYSRIPEIVVLDPSMSSKELKAKLSEVKDATSHFGPARRAVLLKPGVYPHDMWIDIGYYTTVAGVGRGPESVVVPDAWVSNDITDQATNNFWRSLEGVTVTAGRTMWAVSQAAPLRRAIVKNELWLSHKAGYSSGGFMSDVEVNGKLVMGTQQQWYARQVSLPPEGLYCTGGWNYIFQGAVGLDKKDMHACDGGMTEKVSQVSGIPRSAEKPYLVFEETSDWKIYVPKMLKNPAPGAIGKDRESQIDRALYIDSDVFIATPDMSASDINRGMATKEGMLLTPGIYRLDEPLVITSSGFVLLGIGFPTLVSPPGRSCLQVTDFLNDVRIAGIMLDAATPVLGFYAEPLLQWGSRGETDARSAEASTGVASDIFARVGAFKYLGLGCAPVRANTLMEFNSDNLIIDNVWAWHADHDDCSNFTMTPNNNEQEPMLQHKFKSDKCWSQHGVVVNGRNIIAFGVAVEHIIDGHLLVWNGEDGQLYFFQAELPYHSRLNLESRYAAYVVPPQVFNHFGVGIGVYIIDGHPAYAALEISAFTDIRKVLTVVIGKQNQLFRHQVCQVMLDGSRICHQPTHCQWARCYLATLPHGDVEFYTSGRIRPMVLPDVHLLPQPEIKQRLILDAEKRKEVSVDFEDTEAETKFAIKEDQDRHPRPNQRFASLAMAVSLPLGAAALLLLAVRATFIFLRSRSDACNDDEALSLRQTAHESEGTMTVTLI